MFQGLDDLSILGLVEEIGQVFVFECGVPGNGGEIGIEIEAMSRQGMLLLPGLGRNRHVVVGV